LGFDTEAQLINRRYRALLNKPVPQSIWLRLISTQSGEFTAEQEFSGKNMSHFKRIQELPAQLRTYAQTVLANKSLERDKEAQKDSALAALTSILPEGAKSVFVVTQKNVILMDINPQSHAQFDPQDDSPEIKAILAAQREVSQAQSRLNAALTAGKNAGKVKVENHDSIRLEVLTPTKLVPVMEKFSAIIRALRRKPTALAA